MRTFNPGLPLAALAYLLWGLFPLYFHQMASVDAFEIVLHRSAGSLVFLVIVLTVMRRWAWLGPVLRQPRQLAWVGLSAVLLALNWLIYVWSVNHGHVVESSLGYFINPLVYVLLGRVVLHERLRPAQWTAVAVAAAGVLWLTVAAGRPPWIALALATSFGFYGLLRKTAPLGAIEGLMLETLLLAPVALPLLVVWSLDPASPVARGDTAALGWLALAGPLTAVTLILFAAGARRITLATLGLLQYIGPTIQFALGVWWFHEPFDATRAVGFAVIWLALLLYTAESVWRLRRPPEAAAAAAS